MDPKSILVWGKRLLLRRQGISRFFFPIHYTPRPAHNPQNAVRTPHTDRPKRTHTEYIRPLFMNTASKVHRMVVNAIV